jgi:hypothetical protein
MANLIVNGNFSAGFTGWSPSPFSTPTVNPTAGIGGSPCASYSQNSGYLDQTFPVVTGQLYNLSYWYRIPTTGLLYTTTVIAGPGGSATYLNQSDFVTGDTNWVKLTYTFIPSDPIGTATLRIRRTTSQPIILPWLVDDVSVTPFAICYLGKSLVLSKDSSTNTIVERFASDVNSNHQVFSVESQSYIPVVSNLISGMIKNIRKIEAGALGPNQPSEDFYVTGGHTIVHNGREIKVRDMKEAINVSIPKSYIYSIVCPKRTTILVNNIPVIAFGADEVESMIKQNKLKTTDTIDN